MILYYSICTEREGSWQRNDGFILSDDKLLLESLIDTKPKFEGELSWEYDPIRSFEPSTETFKFFADKLNGGIYYGENFELEKLG